MMGSIVLIFLSVAALLSFSVAEISNDIGIASRENLPKPVTYFTLPLTDTLDSEKTQEARLNYPGGVTNVESHGSNVLGVAHGYYPWKFDLGGLLLGSIVGLGALLFIPKVIHLLVPELAALGPAYGSPYKRNVDFLPQGMNEIVSNFERIFAENNIDSSECLQKAICSYVQSSESKSEQMRSVNNENIGVHNSISNTLVNLLMDGSRLKTAFENGKQRVPCSLLYPKCPFNQDSVATGIKQLMFSNTTFSNRESNSRSSLKRK